MEVDKGPIDIPGIPESPFMLESRFGKAPPGGNIASRKLSLFYPMAYDLGQWYASRERDAKRQLCTGKPKPLSHRWQPRPRMTCDVPPIGFGSGNA